MGKALTKTEELKWGMAAHMSALLGALFPLGIVLGPLAVWLFKRTDSSFIESNAKEALNFQITILAISFVLAILSVVSGLFIILAVVTGLVGMCFAVYAGLQTKKGNSYIYPFAIRLIK